MAFRTQWQKREYTYVKLSLGQSDYYECHCSMKTV